MIARFFGTGRMAGQYRQLSNEQPDDDLHDFLGTKSERIWGLACRRRIGCMHLLTTSALVRRADERSNVRCRWLSRGQLRHAHPEQGLSNAFRL